jgi:simple sugar transport system permease protein
VNLVAQLLNATISAGTPLLFATLGGILIERSGVIQLGAEGLMLMGAVTAALTFLAVPNLLLTIAAVLFVGALLGLLHALLTVTLRSNQVVSGLALTLFGAGLSAFLGKSIAGVPLPQAVPNLALNFLSGVPFLGAVFGKLDLLTWLSWLLVVVFQVIYTRTRWGLHLKAVGDNPATADVMGIRVQVYRYLCVALGSALIALGGADLLLVYSPNWIEGMTSGRGWIAVALIIFSQWNPVKALFGTYLFGALDTLGFRMQLAGSLIPPYFLKMLPYVITILVLIFVGWRSRNKASSAPQALGLPYIREQRQ